MSNNLLSRRSKAALMEADHGVCDACGAASFYSYEPIINPLLAKQWHMTAAERESMSKRESMFCLFCGSSYRLRLLARAINFAVTGSAARSFEENISLGALNDVAVAEINSCGVLHDIIRMIPGSVYSEYIPSVKTVHHQDIQNLTYKDKMFDIVLTSDVLEHVPNVSRALEETYRVLRPGGIHLMSVPILMDRKTKIRVVQKPDGSPKHLAGKSYHGAGQEDYLVWTEFGLDFIDMCRSIGFEAHYLFINETNRNDISGIVAARRPGRNNRLAQELPRYDSIEKPISTWNDVKLAAHAYKNKLTQTHIANVEAALQAQITDNQKKQAYINELESRGLKYHLKERINSSLGRRPRV